MVVPENLLCVIFSLVFLKYIDLRNESELSTVMRTVLNVVNSTLDSFRKNFASSVYQNLLSKSQFKIDLGLDI